MRRRSFFLVSGLLVVLLIITHLRFSFVGHVKNALNEGFVPFLVFSTRLQGSFRLLADRFKGYGDLQSENLELRKQLSELSTRVAQVSELERENHEFRSMLDFKDRSELKLISAKVIGREPSNWWNTVLVDRGLVDGIVRDMPVLTIQGLVGKTIEVMKNNARVILISDENCKVSGWMKESSQYGIVQGNILAGGRNSQCRMIFVDRSSQAKNNDKVYTSGLGGIFPKGILIGTVNFTTPEQEPAQSTLYKEVNIIPAVDLSRIDEVFIGTGQKSQEKNRPSLSKKN